MRYCGSAVLLVAQTAFAFTWLPGSIREERQNTAIAADKSSEVVQLDTLVLLDAANERISRRTKAKLDARRKQVSRYLMLRAAPICSCLVSGEQLHCVAASVLGCSAL